MIQRIRLKNFQGHEDSIVELGSGVNCIVGENDSGKTSIFRAVELVRKNRPLGTGYIRKNQPNDAEVEIVNNSGIVTRIRGKNTNEYRIKGIEEPITAFGTNPPEDILDILNLTDINIHSQQDPPFLVISPPGQVAQHIRSISGLDELDKVSSIIKNKLSSQSELLKSQEQKLEEKTKELNNLETINTVRLEELIQQSEHIMEENEHICRDVTELENILTELGELEKEKIILPDDIESTVITSTNLVNEYQVIVEHQLTLTSIIEELDSLKLTIPSNTESTIKQSIELVSKYQEAGTKIIALQEILRDLESLSSSSIKLPTNINDLITKTDEALEQYNNIEIEISVLNTIRLGLVETESDTLIHSKLMKMEQDKLFSLLDQITVCPHCTSTLTEVTKAKLLENENAQK